MLKTLECRGNNTYKSPHIGKAALDRKGLLPDTIDINDEIVKDIVDFLDEGVINASWTSED